MFALKNVWYCQRRMPSKEKRRVRPKRKERLTWQAWLEDWYVALHAQGWVCRNKGISAQRTKLDPVELIEDVLFMQKGTTAVFLNPSIETLPNPVVICEGIFNCKKPLRTFFRIVQGRRPDPKRGVVLLDDGTARQIIPNRDTSNFAPFLVDFAGGLFEPDGHGDWKETQDAEAQAIYMEYLQNSPHLTSFRAYRSNSKRLAPHAFLSDQKSEKGLYSR